MDELGFFLELLRDCDELKFKLQRTSIELETVIMEANEQIRLLLDSLNLVYQERDEARDQSQKLLNKLMPSSPTELLQQQPILRHHQSENPLMVAAGTKANSSITESNSFSDAYNHQSHGSSQVDSFFDAVTSSDLSSINMADSCRTMGFGNQPFVSTGLISSGVTKIDAETTVINDLAKGKTLPEKGKLLQAVMEAGPLLQTLIVAGPLPRWRNPPPLQTFKIPPVSIEVCDSKTASQKLAANPNRTIVQKRLNSSSYPEISRGSNQICSSAMLNFANSDSASGFGNLQLFSTGASVNTQITSGKRQRLL